MRIRICGKYTPELLSGVPKSIHLRHAWFVPFTSVKGEHVASSVLENVAKSAADPTRPTSFEEATAQLQDCFENAPGLASVVERCSSEAPLDEDDLPSILDAIRAVDESCEVSVRLRCRELFTRLEQNAATYDEKAEVVKETLARAQSASDGGTFSVSINLVPRCSIVNMRDGFPDNIQSVNGIQFFFLSDLLLLKSKKICIYIHKKTFIQQESKFNQNGPFSPRPDLPFQPPQRLQRMNFILSFDQQ